MIVGAKYQAIIEEGHPFAIPDWVTIILLFVSAFINGIAVGILWAAAN